MLKHVYLILVATFLFGFVSGFILWLFNQTTEEDIDIFKDDNHQTLSITVHSYGGCAFAGCASYKIDEDGTYTYIVRPQNAEEIRTKGELDREEKKIIEDLLENTSLKRLSETTFTGACPIAYDGLAFKYTIIIDNEYFEFDSCKQNLRNEQLFELLNRYFGIFQNRDRST